MGQKVVEAYLGLVALAFLILVEALEHLGDQVAWEALLHLNPVVVEVGHFHHLEVGEVVVQSSCLEEVEEVPWQLVQ